MKKLSVILLPLILSACVSNPKQSVPKQPENKQEVSKTQMKKKGKGLVPEFKQYTAPSLVDHNDKKKFLSYEKVFFLNESPKKVIITNFPVFSGRELSTEGRKELELFIKELLSLDNGNLKRNGFYVVIDAHSDSSGGKYHNKMLSLARAKNTADFFIKHGLSPKDVYFRGHGEDRPYFSKDASNRRLELLIIARNDVNNRWINHSKQKGITLQVDSNLPSTSYFVKLDAAKAKKAAKTDTPRVKVTRKHKPAKYNFGGLPSINVENSLYSLIGKVKGTSSWYIKNAKANPDFFRQNCSVTNTGFTHSKVANLDMEDYHSHLNGRTWASSGLTPKVFILNLGVAYEEDLVTKSKIQLYSKDNQLLETLEPELVDALQGEKGILYRMFFDGQQPVKCIDVFFNKDPRALKTKAAKLFYLNKGQVFEVGLTLRGL